MALFRTRCRLSRIGGKDAVTRSPARVGRRAAVLRASRPGSALSVIEYSVLRGVVFARLVLRETCPRDTGLAHLVVADDGALDARLFDASSQSLICFAGKYPLFCERAGNLSFSQQAFDLPQMGEFFDGAGALLGNAVSHVLGPSLAVHFGILLLSISKRR